MRSSAAIRSRRGLALPTIVAAFFLSACDGSESSVAPFGHESWSLGEPTVRIGSVADPEYAFHRAERGPPKIDLFVPEAWAAVGVEPVYPVSGSFCHVDTGLPRIRYVLDPERPALQGTRKIG